MNKFKFQVCFDRYFGMKYIVWPNSIRSFAYLENHPHLKDSYTDDAFRLAFLRYIGAQ